MSRLGKATQRAKGWGPSPSCLQAPNLAQPPLALHFPARCVLGQRKGLPEKLSLPDHTSLPPAPQGTRLPSRACGFAAPFLLEARAVIVCSAQEDNHSGRRGLLIEDESSPRLVSQSRVACAGSGAGGSVFEATKLCAAGCPDQCSFPPRSFGSLPSLGRKNQCPEGDGGRLGVFIRAGGALCLPLGAGMQNMKHAQSPFRGAQGQDEKLRARAGEGKFLLGIREKNLHCEGAKTLAQGPDWGRNCHPRRSS